MYPERVGNAARKVRERTGAGDDVGVAADDPHGALEDLEDLVFSVVDVERRAELRGHPELGGAHASALSGAHRELHAHACAHLQDVVAFACLAGPYVLAEITGSMLPIRVRSMLVFVAFLGSILCADMAVHMGELG